MTLVPFSANPKKNPNKQTKKPKNLRNLIILTHGISNDGQALLHGASQLWGRSTIVPVGLSVVPPLGLSDLI